MKYEIVDKEGIMVSCEVEETEPLDWTIALQEPSPWWGSGTVKLN